MGFPSPRTSIGRMWWLIFRGGKKGKTEESRARTVFGMPFSEHAQGKQTGAASGRDDSKVKESPSGRQVSRAYRPRTVLKVGRYKIRARTEAKKSGEVR